MLNLKWLSYSPQILSVNGQLLVNDSKAPSFTRKFNELWSLRKSKKKATAWMSVIPEANAEEEWEFNDGSYKDLALTYAIYETRLFGTAQQAIEDESGTDLNAALPEAGSYKCTPRGLAGDIPYDVNGEKFTLSQQGPLKFHVVTASGERFLLDLKGRTAVFEKGSLAHLCAYASSQPVSGVCEDGWKEFFASHPEAAQIWADDRGMSTINCEMFDVGGKQPCKDFMAKKFPGTKRVAQVNLGDSEIDPELKVLAKCVDTACTETTDSEDVSSGHYWDYVNKAGGLTILGDCCQSESCRQSVGSRNGIQLSPDSSGAGAGTH